MIYHIIKCNNKIQISNNNKIIFLYIRNSFYLYHKYIKELSSNCGKIYKAYKNSLTIIIICYITKCTNKVQININNKILLSYMIDAFYLPHRYIRNLSCNCSKIYRAYKSFLAIITICHITKYINIVQINNKNKTLLLYIINIFNLYYRYVKSCQLIVAKYMSS